VCEHCLEDFDLFYRSMYLPFMKKRFDRAAFISSYADLKVGYQRNRGILFVEERGKRIAGIFFQRRAKTLFVLTLGISNGDNGSQKNLAGTAALFHLIQWAQKNGFATLNYGATLPFFSDGVFTYKNEWGMSISTRADSRFWALKINTLNKGTISFLTHNPFIMFDKGKLRAFVLLDDKSVKTDSGRLASKFMLPGLDLPIVLAYCNRSLDTEGLEEFQELTSKSKQNLTKPLSDFYQLIKSTEKGDLREISPHQQ
jgi:hypothetical protein